MTTSTPFLAYSGGFCQGFSVADRNTRPQPNMPERHEQGVSGMAGARSGRLFSGETATKQPQEASP